MKTFISAIESRPHGDGWRILIDERERIRFESAKDMADFVGLCLTRIEDLEGVPASRRRIATFPNPSVSPDRRFAEWVAKCFQGLGDGVDRNHAILLGVLIKHFGIGAEQIDDAAREVDAVMMARRAKVKKSAADAFRRAVTPTKRQPLEGGDA